MKIAIIASMAFSKEMMKLKEELTKKNHSVILPRLTEEFAETNFKETREESVNNKIKYNLLKYYFEKIKESDAILVANYTKENIRNYIGGNTFLEMGFAHVLDKKIFLLNGVPDMLYSDEIKAMKPIVLDEDLEKVQ